MQCCGAEGPSDWETFGYDFVTYDPTKFQTPASCCDQSRYNGYYYDSTCNKYYQKGCTLDVSDLAAETVLIVASVLLAIGAFQVRKLSEIIDRQWHLTKTFSDRRHVQFVYVGENVPAGFHISQCSEV